MNVLTTPLHWGLSALPLATLLIPVEFTITLMHLHVLMAVTTSLRFWNDYHAFERMLCLFPNLGISIVFTIVFIVLLVYFT